MTGPTDPTGPHWQNRSAFWQILIALASGIIFAQTLGFGWVYDDQMEIVLNPLIRSLRHLPEIFSTTAWAGSGMETYLYRPLTVLSYAVNHLVSGLEPWSFHFVNVLLHAVTSVLVFRLGRAWGLSTTAAGVGGLLFAVHPIHVEVAAAVFGRKDLLAAVFTMAMILWHAAAVERGGWRNILPVAAFACALLSKEVGVVALPLVAAQDWFLSVDRRRLFQSPRRAKLYVAYVTVLLAYVLVRNGVTGGVGIPDTFYMDNPLVAATLGARLATALLVMGKGVGLLALPVTLSPDYSFNAIPLVESLLDWRLLGTLGFGGLVGWALLRTRLSRSLAPLALTWYFLTILPTSNLLITTGTIFGERLLYLPGAAFFLAGGMGMGWTIQKYRTGGFVLTGLIVLLLSLQSLRYSAAWADDLSLFQWATANVPESTKAHHKLGEEYLRAGNLGDALRSLRRSLEIAPDNEFAGVTMAQARRSIATTYLPPEGSLNNSVPAPSDPDILYLLGQLSRERGDLSGAESYWKATRAADPNHAESLGDLGALRLLEGDTATAARYLQEAVRQNAGLASAWFALGRIHMARGEMGEAAGALRRFVDAAGLRYPKEVEWAKGFLTDWGGT
jgi:Tfp pilus assembly protein PilF